MSKKNLITDLRAREVLDSRGRPTVAVRVWSGRQSYESQVPSGASTGAHEAWERRDFKRDRYLGAGVLGAVAAINKKIKSNLVGQTVWQQASLDQLLIDLDGTANKSNLGANATLGVSLATAGLAAQLKGWSQARYLAWRYKFPQLTKTPIPMMNLINGGRHANNGLTVQEFMIVPLGLRNVKSRVRAGSEIFHTLKKILIKQKLSTAVGDEGGFAPDLADNEAALKLLVKSIKAAGYTLDQVKIALDVAASEFYRAGNYYFDSTSKSKTSVDELLKTYQKWVTKYPLMSIEDPFAEDDWLSWEKLSKLFPAKKPLIVGDDLFVTNLTRLKQGLDHGVANSILIKPNQIGTVSETVACIKVAQKNGFKVIISHRSGETTDTFIVDLAVAVGAQYLKAGSLSRSERVAKYNRLLEIDLDQKR